MGRIATERVGDFVSTGLTYLGMQDRSLRHRTAAMHLDEGVDDAHRETVGVLDRQWRQWREIGGGERWWRRAEAVEGEAAARCRLSGSDFSGQLS